jgi:hypothetical protein
MHKLILAAVFATWSAGAESVPDESDRPNPVTAIPMIEAAIRDQLKDPASAQFAWPNGFVWGSYRPFAGRRMYGWITCGTVNARNGYGGYAGRTAAMAIWRYNTVRAAYVDRTNEAGIARSCAKIGVPVN